MDFGHQYLNFPVLNSQNLHWKQAIPTMNFFFSVSKNDILTRIFVFDTHQTLFAHCKETIPKNQNKYSQKRNCAASVPQFPHSSVCERFEYSNHRSAYSAAGKYVDRSWEHINGIFVAVRTSRTLTSEHLGSTQRRPPPKCIGRKLRLFLTS